MGSNGRLTSHVLDLSIGLPVKGIVLELWLIEQSESGQSPQLLRTAVTNEDGRLDMPLLQGKEMSAGLYELVFEAGNYYREHHSAPGGIEFIFDRIPIQFRIVNEEGHYHIPLLVAPGGYSTYRGS